MYDSENGFTQTFVNATIQTMLSLQKHGAIDKIYTRADAIGASRAEVINDFVTDIADEICNIWREELEKKDESFLNLCWYYAEMVAEQVSVDKSLPYLPTFPEYKTWLINKACDKFLNFPKDEDTGDPMDELQDARDAIATIKKLANW